MKKIIKLQSIALVFVLFATASLVGCKKHTNAENLVRPNEQAHFANLSASKLYAITSADSVWIKVGLTSSADYERTVTIVPSSKSAVEGTHYTVSRKVIKFAAGKVLDSFYVKPVDVSRYITGLKDTIRFTITEPSVTPSSYNSTYDLIVRGPCFATDINFGEFDGILGDYKHTKDDPLSTSPYGPYKTTITSWVQTSPTTAKIVINNVWDAGFGDVPFNVDFTDPTAVIVTPIQTITAADAGQLNTAYNGMKIVIRPHSNGTVGSMDWCNNTFYLYYQLGVYNPSTGAVLGYFGTGYDTKLER
jgi:hypothetical protein